MAHYLLSLLLVVTGATAPAQDARQPPETMALGTSSLSLVAKARRTHLLDAVDLYGVAIYVPDHEPLRPALLDPHVAKVLRVEVHAADDLTQRSTIDWRSELIPRLNAAGTAHLRNAVGALRRGDLLLVEYSPQLGTSVRINKTVVVPSASHDLMLAYADHWLGQRPISEEMRRQLLGAPSSPTAIADDRPH
jgi:hypothetical protein